MALTKIETQNIEDGAISTPKLGAEVAASVTLIQSVADAANLIPAITSVNVANSTYDLLDDTAVSIDGGYIVINGTGFSTGAQVLIDGTVATSVTRVSSTQLQVQVPAKTAASYNLYVVNNTGHTAIKVNGLTYSGTPTWVTASTLDNQAVDVAFSVAFNATSATSYANTTALPAGTTLLSNGYFYGTVTGIVEETTYNFTVVATDAENQDSPREFSVTVTVGPPPAYLYANGLDGYSMYYLPLNSAGVSRSSPVLVGSNADWVSISGGQTHSLAIKSNGTLWTWGHSDYGVLGLNSAIVRPSPVQVGTLTNWESVVASRFHSLAIKSDGTLWLWGSNSYSQLGLNDGINRSSPVQVGSDTNWSVIAATVSTSAAIKTDGTLWAWGINNNGQLGQNNTQSKSSPTQVGTNTNWSKIQGAKNRYDMMALRTDGTLWSWGNASSEGVLGINSVGVNKSSPTQIAGTWSNIFSYHEYIRFAMKSDNTLYGWGVNEHGGLGLGNTINRSSPTQIGTANQWELLSAGGYACLWKKPNGTVWASGHNTYGQLGLNDRVNRSSPVQIGTDSTWTNVESGTYQSYLFKT
jgi:hypothetical protein